MSGFTGSIQLVYVLAAACFVVGLHLMNSPATARRGNQVSMAGMIVAGVATLSAADSAVGLAPGACQPLAEAELRPVVEAGALPLASNSVGPISRSRASGGALTGWKPGGEALS